MFPSIPIQNYNILPSMLFHIGQVVSVELISINDNGYIGARIDGKYYIISELIDAAKDSVQPPIKDAIHALSKGAILELISSDSIIKATVLKTAPFILQLTTNNTQLANTNTNKINIETFASLYTPNMNIQTAQQPHIDDSLPKLTLLSFATPLPLDGYTPKIVYYMTHSSNGAPKNLSSEDSRQIYTHNNQKLKISISALINSTPTYPTTAIVDIVQSDANTISVAIIFSGTRYNVSSYQTNDIELLQQSSATRTTTMTNANISSDINNIPTHSYLPHTNNAPVGEAAINTLKYNIVNNIKLSQISNTAIEVTLPTKDINDTAYNTIKLTVDHKSLLPLAISEVSTLIVVHSNNATTSSLAHTHTNTYDTSHTYTASNVANISESKLHNINVANWQADNAGNKENSPNTVSNATVSNATVSNATVSNATASNATASNATASNATASNVVDMAQNIESSSHQAVGSAPADNQTVERHSLAQQMTNWQPLLEYISLLSSQRSVEFYINFPSVSHKVLPTTQFQNILIHLILNSEITVKDNIITIGNIVAQVLSSTTVGVFTPEILLGNLRKKSLTNSQTLGSNSNIYTITQAEQSSNSPSKKITSLLHQLLKLDPFAISTIAASSVNFTNAESLRQLILNGGVYYENKIKNSADTTQDLKYISTAQSNTTQTAELTYLQLANILLNDSFTALFSDQDTIENGVIHIKRERLEWGVGVVVYLKMSFTAIGDTYVTIKPSGGYFNNIYFGGKHPASASENKYLKYSATIMTEFDISALIATINIDSLTLKWKKLEHTQKKKLDEEIFNVDKRLISQLGQFDITI